MQAQDSRAKALAEFKAAMHRILTRQEGGMVAAIVYLILFVQMPAMTLAGFGHEGLVTLVDLIDWHWWLVIFAIVGALAGATIYPKYWYMGIGPGLALGPTIMLATQLYLSGRARTSNYELVLIVFMPILVPFWLWYYYTLRWQVVRDIIRRDALVSGSNPAPTDPSEESV